MKILVINSGSSSLKFQVIDSETEKVMARGLCERIGIDGSFTYKTDSGVSLKEPVPMNNHKMCIRDSHGLFHFPSGRFYELERHGTF